MAVGKRKKTGAQQEFWVETSALPRGDGHPFYTRLNALLDRHGFDKHAEALCAPFYAEGVGRPGLAPGTYFRMLFIGYFEGIGADRAIAWRVRDSLSLRDFLGIELTKKTPDPSTLSGTRRRIALETHHEIFQFVLGMLAQEGLLQGGELGIDTTTLEANAAMRSIVRRDTGEQYHEFLGELARESGIETPTRAQLAKLDKNRKGKGSNSDWESPHDPDARITKMKDGTTHLAHKTEHAVDLQTGALVAITVQHADTDDRQTLPATLGQARENLYRAAQNETARQHMKPLKSVVCDKGYHSTATLDALTNEHHLRPNISEPERPRRKWKGREEEQQLVYANRTNTRSKKGRAQQRKRAELVERSFAHCYETGGLRRMHIRGHQEIRKRTFTNAAAFNLGLAMRKLVGAGTPKQHKETKTAAISPLWRLTAAMCAHIRKILCPSTSKNTQPLAA